MISGGRTIPALLFLGDALVFIFSLWLTLLVRYAEAPNQELLTEHFLAFSVLFVIWLLVFYMAGLYGKRVIFAKTALFGAILWTQVLNIVLAALFFFFMPGIGIAPKTNLVLYLVISLALILAWRLYAFPRISRPTTREIAALVGEGSEVEELMKEVNGNPRYHISFAVSAAPAEFVADPDGFARRLKEADISLLVVDAGSDVLRPLLGKVYELSFIAPGYQFADFHEMYEEVFDRVPLSLLQYDWFLKNVSTGASAFYPAIKRSIDIVGGLLMGVITIILTPFIALFMRLEGPGPVFIAQDRIGRYGALIKAYKFRSMGKNNAASATFQKDEDHQVTKLGSVLRRTSLDEFPQFINVLKGEMSLIGPRNDILGLGLRLGEAIPYYNVRYVVPPGITGWAQINQQYEPGNISPQSIEETKMRLAYDFYYIKNRSLTLDIVIALKTVKRMLFRVSSW